MERGHAGSSAVHYKFYLKQQRRRSYCYSSVNVGRMCLILVAGSILLLVINRHFCYQKRSFKVDHDPRETVILWVFFSFIGDLFYFQFSYHLFHIKINFSPH